MKNKKILRIFDECIADAKNLMVQAEAGDSTISIDYTKGRYNMLTAMKGRFEGEIKKEKEVKKNIQL
jgi:hypothetical protein